MTQEKILTLRGQFTIDDNALGHGTGNDPVNIFTYEAQDMTKGWEISHAYIFPETIRGTYTSSGQSVYQFTLLTDRAAYTDFGQITNVTDNRQCGWNIQGWVARAGNFIANNGAPLVQASQFVLDPHTIVVNQLWIYSESITDGGASPSRTWNYLVVLKPKKMRPEQTILQIVKGTGQNVTN